YLDELGLDKRASDGTRLLPNGKPLVLNVYSTLQPMESVIQMSCNYFQAVGVNARIKLVTRSALNRHIATGNLAIGAIGNLGDSYFGPLLPANYAPSHPAENAQWNAWSLWYFSKGKGGTEPPAHFKERKAQWDRVINAKDPETMKKEWHVLTELTKDELPFFGVTTSPGQVIYVKNGFKNVPQVAIAGWIAHQPGNCCPEVFYKEKETQ
ncbi:MAG: hypothetical protein HRU15_13390, partial [Planctomycetes bacterium]|nr:hypothetical protein [Planctomycetota bacterium]